MKFPDFIIIGVAKCGTTPLWYNIEKHPDITMGPKDRSKIEMYFWGTYRYDNKEFDWYKQKFKGKVSGEKTPAYCTRNYAIMQMKKEIPDVKLIMCIRHPVERAYSNYKMNVKGGKIRIPFNYNLMIKRYGGLSRYINLLNKNILPFFDRSQLHICVTEWMKKNTVEEMNKIYDFLNLEIVDIERRVIDVNKSRVKPPSKNMELIRSEPWYRVYDQYSETVSGELRQQGLDYYKKWNERLFEFLGYEIEEWKV